VVDLPERDDLYRKNIIKVTYLKCECGNGAETIGNCITHYREGVDAKSRFKISRLVLPITFIIFYAWFYDFQIVNILKN